MNNSYTHRDTLAAFLEFSSIDYAIIVALLVLSLAIGIFIAFYRDGCRTTDDFLFGSYKMSSVSVALSLLARWNWMLVCNSAANLKWMQTKNDHQLCGLLWNQFALNMNFRSESNERFNLQSTLADCDFNDACGNLFIWMAVHDVHPRIDACYVGAVLYFFADSLSQ